MTGGARHLRRVREPSDFVSLVFGSLPGESVSLLSTICLTGFTDSYQPGLQRGVSNLVNVGAAQNLDSHNRIALAEAELEGV